MPTGTEKERFRSFAERYLIERANKLRTLADAWKTILDAKTMYKQIELQGRDFDPPSSEQMQVFQQAANQAANDAVRAFVQGMHPYQDRGVEPPVGRSEQSAKENKP